MQCHDGIEDGEDLREDGLDFAQPAFASYRRPQHCGLHFGQEQHHNQLQGHVSCLYSGIQNTHHFGTT